MASCATHDDPNYHPSEVLGNFEVSDFSKNFAVIRILPKVRHTQKVDLYGKIEKSNFSCILRNSRILTFCNDVTILGYAADLAQLMRTSEQPRLETLKGRAKTAAEADELTKLSLIHI